ncbi:hypothetical protein [Marinigracilibium pacificum]|uniref:Uncharacterized protein n=1 Tax=Marinigracilibium pacificum TaxID=2729599 RepID=A0A848IWQ9_9BACT|nr:hypothetical protein [Marinigracilibium pacificum]NMM47711.1 hypothetical protein [Marinigracilibium pacificum]
MKLPMFLFCSFFLTAIYGQESSLLYDKVIEIMKAELNYTYDSTSNQVVEHKSNFTRQSKGIHPSSPSPLVILNREIIKMETLKEYHLKEIKDIEILQPDKPKAGVLYGTRGASKV